MVLGKISGQTTGTGQCPKVQAVQNFDLNRYIGAWFIIKNYPNPFSRSGDRCSTATYGFKADGNVSVLNQQVLADGSEGTVQGFATLVSSGILTVTIPTSECE